MNNLREKGFSPIEDVVRNSQLKPESLAWLHSVTSRNNSRWREAFGEIIYRNPRFHFTTAGFTFDPASEHEQQLAIDLFGQNGWGVSTSEDSSLRVDTGYIQNIVANGLREMTCVATMPAGESQQLMRSHPRLFLEGVRKIVRRFGKHAVPYKHQALQAVRGSLSDIEAAVVIADESAIVRPEGKGERTVLSSRNILAGRTHFVPGGVAPEQILGIAQFPVGIHVICPGEGQQPIFNHQLLSEEIITGVRSVLPEMVRDLGTKNGHVRDVGKAQRIAHLFRTLASHP